MLTAEIRIRVKAPLPLPRKRELTGDTKIRLSQIKGLREWTEDQKYEIGQISTRTGLLKTAEGWVVPPHSMIPGSQRSIEETHRIGGGGAGESESRRKYKTPEAQELYDHISPKKKLLFSKEQIKKLLNFKAKKTTVPVNTPHGVEQVEVPAAFMQNSREQRYKSKEYQELTKDLAEQINYLRFYDFNGKTPQDVSDSLRLMGFVNACAFKRKKNLTDEEHAINDVIYEEVKDVYVPNAVDYFLKTKASVTYDPRYNVIFLTSPVTKVQISFHEYYEQPYQDIPRAKEYEWNEVKHSYIYANPEEMERFEKLRERIRKTTKDEKLLNDDTIEPIIKTQRGKNMKYDVYFADDEIGEFEYENDDKALEELKYNRQHGSIRIEKIVNQKTGKEITLD